MAVTFFKTTNTGQIPTYAGHGSSSESEHIKRTADSYTLGHVSDLFDTGEMTSPSDPEVIIARTSRNVNELRPATE